MLFAVLIQEREPLRWVDLPRELAYWVQVAGGVAAFGLFIIFLANVIVRSGGKSPLHVPLFATHSSTNRWSLTRLFVILAGAAGVAYVILIGLFLVTLGFLGSGNREGVQALVPWQSRVGTVAGALALTAVALPVLVSAVTRLRWGRIWALALLSLKEAIRSRIFLVFGAIAVVFLFAGWFVGFKPEDQLRNYVLVSYMSMAVLLLTVASLLGSFSIPTDVRNQSIHTIVTKPVERYEIVLGRFLGYGILLTVALAAMGGLSLIYILRGVTPQAAEEGYKARVPIYSDELHFIGTKERNKADSVGREWRYRSYIGGSRAQRQYAIWDFQDLPAELGQGDRPVRFEYAFDIFRLSKSEGEKGGIYCTFLFADGRLSPKEVVRRAAEIREKRTALQAGKKGQAAREEARKALGPGAAEQEVDALVAHKLADELIAGSGVYEVAAVEVVDYHTRAIFVPRALFAYLNQINKDGRSLRPGGGGETPMLQALVSQDPGNSQAQMLGVAKSDFYLLAAEGTFWVNFFKGLAGLWFMDLLVLGLAVCLSTYLSGVIAWMATLFLVGIGFLRLAILRLSEQTSGPIEAALRIWTRRPEAMPLEQGPEATLIMASNTLFRWWLKVFVNLLPDPGRFDLHDYVAEGFDIPWARVLLLDSLLPLAAYLVPCFILAYYLMQYREIANPS